MKKIKIFLPAMLALCVNAKAQLWNLDGSGNVTTTTPGNCYVQGGSIDMSMPSDIPRYIIANSVSSSLNLLSGTTNTNGAYIGLHSVGNGGGMNLHTIQGGSFLFYNWQGGPSFNQLMQIANTGDVTISGNGIINKNLSVQGGQIDMTAAGDPPRNIIANSLSSSMSLLSGTTNTNGAYIGLHTTTDGGGINLHTMGAGSFLFYNYSGGIFNQIMSVSNDGKLSLSGGLINMAMPATDIPRYITANSSNSSLNFLSGHTNTDGAYIGLHANGDGGGINFHTMNSGSFLFYNWNGGSFNQLMQIKNDGAVVIGDGSIATPNERMSGGYSLYVQYGILTEKLKVANSGDLYWSDFVFNKDYKLRSLGDVESYVKANKHLPEVPSAKEVAEDGIDVASMDAKLLQKIEELTLYVIQQQKEIETQKAQIKTLIEKLK